MQGGEENLMTQTIDPVFSSAVLSAPELALNDLDFDALSQAMGGLKGEVDKNPQTAAIILQNQCCYLHPSVPRYTGR